MSVRPGEAYGLLIGDGPAPVEDLPIPVGHFDAAAGSIENPYFPRTRQEAESLPSGAHFFDPAGVLRERH